MKRKYVQSSGPKLFLDFFPVVFVVKTTTWPTRPLSFSCVSLLISAQLTANLERKIVVVVQIIYVHQRALISEFESVFNSSRSWWCPTIDETQ